MYKEKKTTNCLPGWRQADTQMDGEIVLKAIGARDMITFFYFYFFHVIVVDVMHFLLFSKQIVHMDRVTVTIGKCQAIFKQF